MKGLHLRPSRRALRLAAALLFTLQFVLLDLVFRGARAWVDRPSIVVAAVESALVWWLLLALCSSRRRKVALALLAAALVTAQAYVFRFFHAPFDLQVAEAARHQWRDVRGVLVGHLPWVGLALGASFVVELALLEIAPRVRESFAHRLSIATALAGLFGVEPRMATPDVRAVHALRALAPERRPPVAVAVALPTLHSDRREIPDVLFVLTESVRASDYVTSGAEATAPDSSALMPGRVDLREMRAIASYTVLSLSAVLTGRSQEAERRDILGAANLFDFARAAGARVAYYSAHSKETFEAKDVRAAVDTFVTLETLAGRDEIEDDSQLVLKPLDEWIVERFVADLPSTKSPSVTVLHLAGTHAPYYFDDARAPFQPFDRAVAWSKMPRLHNAYKNAIREQDRQVARALRAFVDHAGGRPWLVAFTSDHGEAFGEHGAIHHGQNLYDEQVHVPAWIAAGPNTLGEAGARALADHSARFVTHLDVLPTVLDAMGLWDNFAVRPHREKMRGVSLVRPYVSRGAIPLTNCTEMFRCPLDTWGLIADDLKLIAQTWDAGWRCLELAGGERPARDGDPRCLALHEASRRHFSLLPNGSANR